MTPRQQKNKEQFRKFLHANTSIADPHKSRMTKPFGCFSRFERAVTFKLPFPTKLYDGMSSKKFCISHTSGIIGAMRREHSIYLNEAAADTIPTLDFISCLRECCLHTGVPEDALNLTYGQLGNLDPEYANMTLFDNWFVFGFDKSKMASDDIAPVVIVDIPMLYSIHERAYKAIAAQMHIVGYEMQEPELNKLDDQPVPGISDLVIARVTFESHMSTYEFKPDVNLHHVTRADNFMSIKQHGLVPKSHSAEYSYPDRVYLFNKASDMQKVEYGNYKTDWSSNDVLRHAICIFTVNTKKLVQDNDVKLYVDAMFSSEDAENGVDDTACFAEQDVPLSCIEDTVFLCKIPSRWTPADGLPDGHIVSLSKTNEDELRKLVK